MHKKRGGLAPSLLVAVDKGADAKDDAPSGSGERKHPVATLPHVVNHAYNGDSDEHGCEDDEGDGGGDTHVMLLPIGDKDRLPCDKRSIVRESEIHNLHTILYRV